MLLIILLLVLERRLNDNVFVSEITLDEMGAQKSTRHWLVLTLTVVAFIATSLCNSGKFTIYCYSL